jgi:hypothetical protein
MIKLIPLIEGKTLLNETITNGILSDKVERYILKNYSSGDRILNSINKGKLKEIPMGKYIGDCKAHHCDANSMKKARTGDYDLYHGVIFEFTNNGNLDTLSVHTFNVKNGKVYEFTYLDNIKNIRYFGKKVDKKDWKGYQYDKMKKYNW